MGQLVNAFPGHPPGEEGYSTGLLGLVRIRQVLWETPWGNIPFSPEIEGAIPYIPRKWPS